MQRGGALKVLFSAKNIVLIGAQPSNEQTIIVYMYVGIDSVAPAHARTRAYRPAAPRQSSGVSQTPHPTAQAGIPQDSTQTQTTIGSPSLCGVKSNLPVPRRGLLRPLASPRILSILPHTPAYPRIPRNPHPRTTPRRTSADSGNRQRHDMGVKCAPRRQNF